MQKGFALIYVLVITVIIMITITSILTLGSSDIRQKRKVSATAGAWQMAQSGIEDGISRYQADPSSVCAKTSYYNVLDDQYYTIRTLSPVNTDQGAYGFVVSCVSSPVQILSTGHFKGSRVKMEADMGTDNTMWDIYQIGS